MGRRAIVAWGGLLALSAIPGLGSAAAAGGLTSPVCVSLGVLLALTVTPVESIVAAFTSYLPTTTTE